MQGNRRALARAPFDLLERWKDSFARRVFFIGIANGAFCYINERPACSLNFKNRFTHWLLRFLFVE